MMKKFLLRFVLFVPLLLVGVSAKPYYLIIGDKYQSLPKQAWVYTALNQSNKKDNKAKFVVIGDSVGNQLFKVGRKENDGPIYSMTCSAAIDVVGQYILMHNFLEHSKPEVIYYISNGYKYNLNAPQVFHYFLKAFYTSDNQQHLTEQAKQRIRSIPYFFLSQVPHIYTTTWGPKIPFVPDTTGVHFSDLTVEYLKKMEALAKEKGVKFLVIPPPIKASRKPSIDKNLQAEISKNGLDHMFRYYFEVLRFNRGEEFRDQIHLKPQFTDKHIKRYRKLIKEYAQKP